MKLSRKRAESVKQFLSSAGIDEGRIGTIGYGPDKPIADNETKEGQEKNRRIEFRLLSTGEKVEIQPEPEDINPSPERASRRRRPRPEKTDKPKADARDKPAQSRRPARRPLPRRRRSRAASRREEARARGEAKGRKGARPPPDGSAAKDEAA